MSPDCPSFLFSKWQALDAPWEIILHIGIHVACSDKWISKHSFGRFSQWCWQTLELILRHYFHQVCDPLHHEITSEPTHWTHFNTCAHVSRFFQSKVFGSICVLKCCLNRAEGNTVYPRAWLMKPNDAKNMPSVKFVSLIIYSFTSA